MAQAPIISYDAHIITPGYNLQISVSGSNVSATYDDYPTDASGVAAHCSLSISYTNVHWVINSDNSVTVSGNITGGVLTRTHTGVASSQSQLITATFDGHKIFRQTVSTASSGTYYLNLPVSFSVTFPPSDNPQPSYVASIDFKNDNTTSSNPPDEFYLGIIVTNPNPPDYRPGTIRNSNGVWLSHNRTGGEAHILTSDSGSWREMRTEGNLTVAGNPPSIYINSKWMNQRKIGKE